MSIDDDSVMEVTSGGNFWDDIFAADHEKCLEAVRLLKNRIIGSNRQKDIVFENNLLPKLLSFVCASDCPVELSRQVTIVLGSLAKGSRQQVACLVAARTVQKLLNCLFCHDLPLIEAALRCLRNIFVTDMAPTEVLYEDEKWLGLLLGMMELSSCAQQCAAVILSRSCLTHEHQTALHEAGVLTNVAPLLFSGIHEIQLPALKCLTALCFENVDISTELMKSNIGGVSVVDRIVSLISREQHADVQLATSKCVSNICRNGLISPADPIIINKAMPTLVRLCRDDPVLCKMRLRIEALFALAYLTEEDIELQRLAAENNQCLRTLANCLHWSSSASEETSGDVSKDEAELSEELEEAALTALSSLALNDEEIRRKVVGTEVPLFECILRSGCDENANPKHLLAVCRCLHALSRSVEQLRTTFQDRPVWKSLLTMAQSPNQELAALASATLSNLCLDFSPCKAGLFEAGAVDVLCSLTRRDEHSLRLNGVWGLMTSVMKSFGSEQFLRLLTEAPTDSPIIVRTLCLLRNILSGVSQDNRVNSHFIDQLMSTHGAHVIQAVIYILEGEYDADAKELALCILTNVAAGNTSKEFIMSNEDILRKITNYMMVNNSKLQIAATFCVWNLVHKDDNGCEERQARLRDLGVQKMLKQMENTAESELFEKVKDAIQQFS